VVVNYCLPKSGNSSAVTTPGTSFTNPTKIQKPKAQRQISNLPHATVKDIIQGNAKGLATLANIPQELSSASDQTSSISSKTDSAPSSSSSTPMVSADSIMATQDQIPLQPGLFARWADYYPGVSTSSNNDTNQQPEVASENEKSCCCSGSSAPESAPVQTEQPKVQSFGNGLAAFQPQAPNNVHINLADLDTDFDSYEFSPGCPMPPSHQDGLSVDRSCECGDSCSCFACTEHPHNRTTMDYVRYHSNLALDPHSSQNGGYSNFAQHPQMVHFLQPHALGHLQMAPSLPEPFIQSPNHGFAAPTFEMSGMNWSSPMIPQMQNGLLLHQNMGIPQPGVFIPNHVGPTPYPAPIRQDIAPSFQSLSMESMPNHPQHQLIDSTAIKQSPTLLSQDSTLVGGFSTDADSVTDEDSTLSPSTFLVQQFTLDCEDTTGTCQCDDGCSCPGCLVHSGHIDPNHTTITS
jgi:hypothetical protein